MVTLQIHPRILSVSFWFCAFWFCSVLKDSRRGKKSNQTPFSWPCWRWCGSCACAVVSPGFHHLVNKHSSPSLALLSLTFTAPERLKDGRLAPTHTDLHNALPSDYHTQLDPCACVCLFQIYQSNSVFKTNVWRMRPACVLCIFLNRVMSKPGAWPSARQHQCSRFASVIPQHCERCPSWEWESEDKAAASDITAHHVVNALSCCVAPTCCKSLHS